MVSLNLETSNSEPTQVRLQINDELFSSVEDDQRVLKTKATVVDAALHSKFGRQHLCSREFTSLFEAISWYLESAKPSSFAAHHWELLKQQFETSTDKIRELCENAGYDAHFDSIKSIIDKLLHKLEPQYC